MRIMFVDDESRVLDGLRRMLFKQRGVWTMSFVTSGAEALEAMAQEPFDLIVTDMRMPQMDGATLLERVREAHPRTVRLVLSGHADIDQAMRVMTVAHQYLAKPCEGPTLIATIEQAMIVRRLLETDELRELVIRIGNLPPAPSTYTRMMKLMSDDNTGIDDYAALLEEDPGLTAKLLQVANSAYFSSEGRVSEAGAAASRIGLNALRSLTLFIEAPGQFGTSTPAVEAIGREVAERGQRAATLARRFCEVASGREAATTAALLHELGRLALAAKLETEYAHVLTSLTKTHRPLQEVEQEVLGADHAAVGAYLFALWQLPSEVVEAIARHHEQESLPTPLDAAGAVRLAAAMITGVIPEDWRQDPRWDTWQSHGDEMEKAA